MHVIRDRKTRQTLYIDYRETAGLSPGDSVYPAFNSDDMEIGWTTQPYVPAFYDIDKEGLLVEVPLEEAARRGWHQLDPAQEIVNGKITTKSDEQLMTLGILDLAAIKAQLIEQFSQAAFELRARIIPDYKLQNAALGVYDEDITRNYRATVEAFRDEFKRAKSSIEQANTVQELREIQPRFPSSVVSGVSPSDKPRRKK